MLISEKRRPMSAILLGTYDLVTFVLCSDVSFEHLLIWDDSAIEQLAYLYRFAIHAEVVNENPGASLIYFMIQLFRILF